MKNETCIKIFWAFFLKLGRERPFFGCFSGYKQIEFFEGNEEDIFRFFTWLPRRCLIQAGGHTKAFCEAFDWAVGWLIFSFLKNELQSKVSSNGRGQDDSQYGQTNHDHNLLLQIAATQVTTKTTNDTPKSVVVVPQRGRQSRRDRKER